MFNWPSYCKLLIPSLLLYAPAVWSIDQIKLSTPFEASSQLPEFGGAYKSKIESIDNGIVVIVYGDYVEDNPLNYAFDLKSNIERPARDIFVTTCDSVASDCSDEENWSVPINLSNTAQLWSMPTDWNADGNRTNYYGDSDNPHIFSSGKHMVVSWADKYCPGGQQRSVTYLEFDSREIPMSCIYVAHATDSFSQLSDWTIDRLSDGSRDVKQDNNKGNGAGAWAVIWQEDPLGLQPGEAEGPGEGSSGAKVSHGTDIWYSYTTNVATADSDIGIWKTPVRITDNHTGFGLAGSFNPIKNIAGNPVDPDQIDKGITGASRPNMAVVSGSNPPNAVIAYEESKGSAGLDEGKFLRYHVFPYDSPPATAIEKAGCIVSDPAENARRARFVAQTNAASGTGLRLALFWRQGLYDQGGPADIMLRLGYRSADIDSTGLRPTDFNPPVDSFCSTSDYTAAINLNNTAPLNLSSNTLTATEANLLDSSDDDFLENARAHRAVLRANDLYLGYIYTEDGIVADATDLANYNFFVRHFNASTGVWGKPKNLSNITNTGINVLEPRLMGTPGNQPGCTDPDNITNPENCQNKNVVIAAWGTETNVYEHIGGSENLDVYLTRTTDKTAHWEPITNLAAGPNSQGESQLRVTPDGNRIFAVWNETRDDITNAMFSQGTPVTLYSDMSLSADSFPSSVYAGTSFNVDYRVENFGPNRAYDINLVINLPASVQYLSASDFCTHDSGIVTCAPGDIDINSGIDIEVTVQSTIVDSLLFVAAIESETLDDPDTDNNQVQSVVNATMASDVAVAVSSSKIDVDVGDLAGVTYQISNAGPSQAEAVKLTQTLPEAISFVSALPNNCSATGNEVSCDIGSLAGGDRTEITIEYRVDVAGQTRFDAAVSSDQFDPNTDNNQASITINSIPSADISLHATVDRSPALITNSRPVINLEVSNLGPQNSSMVELEINTPDEWEQRSLSISQGSCLIAEPSLICDIGDVDAGASVLVRLEGTIRGASSVKFRASVSAAEQDPDLDNNHTEFKVKADKDESHLEKIFGCSIAKGANSKTIFDPTLLVLLLFAFYKISRARFNFNPREKLMRDEI